MTMSRQLVDSHLHVWERARNPQPWIDCATMAAIDRDFPPQQAVDEIRSAGVDGCVVVQCVNEFSETLDLLEAGNSFPSIVGVVGWLDLAADIPAQLDSLRQAPGGGGLVGIRHVTMMETDEEWLTRPSVRRGIQILAQAGLPFDVVVRPWQLAQVKELAESLDSATFVLDHLGKPPLTSTSLAQWAVDFGALATCPNVVAKVSGLVTEDDWERWTPERLRPVVDHALQTFGPARLMFGSDWPLAELAGGYARWKAAYLQLTDELAAADQAAIDRGTARRIYGLS
jgi:L-fuconolactonase